MRETERHFLNPEEDLKLPCPDTPFFPSRGGILLSDEIAKHVDSAKLITPFNEDHLKPAAYELSLGERWACSTGRKSESSDAKKVAPRDAQRTSPEYNFTPLGQWIRIPAASVVVLTSAEVVNLPRYLVGHWNLRVRLAYQGLSFFGGAQVDPGWVGRLACPVYNLSDSDVELKVGEPFAVLEFAHTTEYHPDPDPSKKWSPTDYRVKSKAYPRPPPLRELWDRDVPAAGFRQNLTEMGDRVDRLAAQLQTQESLNREYARDFNLRIGNNTDTVMTVASAVVIGLTVLITALAVFVAIESHPASPSTLNLVAIVFATIALALSAVLVFRSRRRT